MNELVEGVNWLAVIVGFFASFMLGWFWYSPKLFGEKWAKGVGVNLDGADEMPKMAMITQAIATFGLSWLVGITAAQEALLTIVLIIVTVAIFVVSNGKFAEKSNYAVAVEGSFIIVMGIVMIVCQGIF